jgi:hypothetical protein
MHLSQLFGGGNWIMSDCLRLGFAARIIKSVFSILLLGIVLLGSGGLRAEPVTIKNHSFEKDVQKNGATTRSTSGWTARDAGTWNPSPGQPGCKKPDVFIKGIPDGDQVAYLNGHELSQKTAEKITEGHSYTLKVGVGARCNSLGVKYSVQLLAGKTQLVAKTGTNLKAGWTEVTVTYDSLAGDPNAGKPLTVQFKNLGRGQINYDDVRLDAAKATFNVKYILPDHLSIPGLDHLPIRDLKKTGTTVSAQIKLRGKSATVVAFKVDGTSLAAIVPKDFKLTDVVPVPRGTPADGVSFKDIAFIYVPKGKAKPRIAASSFPSDVRKAVQHTGSHVSLKEGLNLFGQGNFQSAGAIKDVLRTMGHNRVALPLAAAFPADLFKHDLKTASQKIKDRLLTGLKLDLPLPKLRIPGMPNIVSVSSARLAIVGREVKGKPKIFAGVTGGLDMKIGSRKHRFSFGILAGDPGKQWTATITAESKDKATLALAASLTLTDMKFTATRKGGKWDAAIDAKSKLKNKEVDVVFSLHANEGPSAVITAKTKLILADLSVGNIPGLSEVELDTIDILPGRMWLQGKLKGVNTFFEVQKAYKVGGHFVAAYLDKMPLTDLIPGAGSTPLKDVGFSEVVALYSPEQSSALSGTGLVGNARAWVQKSNSNPTIKPGLNIFGHMNVHPSGEMAKLLKKAGVTDLKLPLNGGFSPKAFAKNLSGSAIKNEILDNLDLNIKIPTPHIPEVSNFLTFKNARLKVKGKTPDGKRGIDVGISGDADVHVKRDTVAFNVDVEFDKSELVFKGSTTKKWTYPLGIHWLELDSLTLDVDKKKGKYDIKIAAKTDIGSHSRLDVKVDIHEKNGKITDASFELDGPLKLSDIPEIKDIPNASHFEINTIKVSEHGIEAKTDFGAKKDLDVFLFHGSGWNLIVRQDNFVITEIVPPLKNTPLKHIVLSKDGLQGPLKSFSPIARDALKDIYGKDAANIDVDRGLSLIAAFEHKKSKGKMADAFSRMGLSQERVILTGDIGGMFGGPARLDVKVALSGHTGAKRQPKWMKSKPGVEAVFSMIATESAGQFDIEFGIGVDIIAQIHGDTLLFEAKTALEIQDEKIDVKIVADMKDNKGWKHPFGIPGFTMYEVGFDLGIVEDGALHLGFDGSIRVTGKKYAIAADVELEGPIPQDVAFVGSADQVDMFFMEEIAIAMMGGDFKLDLPEGILPTYTKVKFAFVTPGGSDPDLHIPGKNSPLKGSEGFALQGAMNWLGHELGSMEMAVSPTNGILADAKIDNLNLGPLHLKNNDFTMKIGLKSVPTLKIDSDIELLGIKERFKVAFGKNGITLDAKLRFGPDFSMTSDMTLSGVDISATKPSFKDADFSMDGKFQLDIGKFISGPARKSLDGVFTGLSTDFNNARNAIKTQQTAVNGWTKKINAERAKVRKEKAAAEARVQSAENRVNGLNGRLRYQWGKYHSCHGWGKWPCRTRWGIHIGWTKGELRVADAALDFVKTLISHFPIDLDPKVAVLIGERDTAKGLLYVAEKALEGADDLDGFMKKAVDKLTKDLKHSINIHKAEFKGDLRGIIETDTPVDLTLDAELFGANIKDTFAFKIKDLGYDVEQLGLMGLYALEHLVEKGISDIPGPLKQKLKGAISTLMDKKSAKRNVELAKYKTEFSGYNKTAKAIQERIAAYNTTFLKAQLAENRSPLDSERSETFTNELIEVGHTGLCLTNAGGGIEEGICANAATQKWFTEPVSGAPHTKPKGGYVIIRNQQKGDCLVPEGKWVEVETKFSDPKLPKEGSFTFLEPQFQGDGKILANRCHNRKEYYWKVLKHGDGWMQMANLATNHCLHFTNSSAYPGVAKAEWKPCTGAANQVYRLADSVTPKYHADNIVLRNDQLGLCVGPANAKGEVPMTACNKATRFDYSVDIRGYVKFINRATGKCLQPSSYAHGAKMIEVVCTQLDYQWWDINNQPGGIIIKNAQTKLCTEPPFRYGFVPPTQVDCKERHNAVFAPVKQENSGPTWKLVTPNSLPPVNQRFATGTTNSLCTFDYEGSFVPGLVGYGGKCVISTADEEFGNKYSTGQYRLATSTQGVVWRQNTGGKLHQTNIPTGGFGGASPKTLYTCKVPKRRERVAGSGRQPFYWKDLPAATGWTPDGKYCHVNVVLSGSFTSSGRQDPARSFKILSRSDADYFELKLTN